jgi:hypothetical protein
MSDSPFYFDINQNAEDVVPVRRVTLTLMTADQADDITWALNAFTHHRDDYTLYRDYLRGDHRLSFASSEYRKAFAALLKGLHVNICPAVVGALTDRLKVSGFTARDNEAAGQAAWDLWEDSRMAAIHNRIHREAIALGDAYMLVWPDQSGRVRFYPHSGLTMVHDHDAEEPEVITKAAKLWKDGKRYRLNLYYPDRIEKYQTARDSTLTTALEAKQFESMDEDVDNPYGRVPVFHFPFDSDTHAHGNAELRDIVPIQDALNKTMHDMIVAGEFAAFPQRVLIGVEAAVHDDGSPASSFQAGLTRVMTLANPEAKASSFPAADLEKYQAVKAGFYQDIAVVKGIPMHYFHMGGDFPSGESLKTAEARLVKRVEDTQVDFGDTWSDLMAFALVVDRRGQDMQLQTVWDDPASRNERSEADTALIKKEIGVSEKQLLKELGYTPDEITEMEIDRETETAAATARFGRAFDSGQFGT